MLRIRVYIEYIMPGKKPIIIWCIMYSLETKIKRFLFRLTRLLNY